ncbi:MAG TPA: CHAT domain-containing protein [Polyangiaceae bacterium]|nr:CHAT domain-containing protein [Polyangiaceae bacterium]
MRLRFGISCALALGLSSSVATSQVGPDDISSTLVLPGGQKVELPQDWAAIGQPGDQYVNRIRPILPLLQLGVARNAPPDCGSWEAQLRSGGVPSTELIPRPDFVPEAFHSTGYDKTNEGYTTQTLWLCLPARQTMLVAVSYTLTDSALPGVRVVLEQIAAAAGARVRTSAPAQPTVAPRSSEPAPSSPSLMPKVPLPPVERYDPAELEQLRSFVEQGLAGGYYDFARPIATRVIEIVERKLGKNSAALLPDLERLVRLRVFSADPGADQLIQRAAEIAHENGGARGQASTLTSYAALKQKAYDYVGAHAHLERALALLEADRGPQSAEVASVLLLLAELELDSGDYVRPSARLTRALEITTRRDRNAPEQLGALVARGRLYVSRGDLELGRKDYLRASEIAERLAPNDVRRHPPLRGLALLAEAQGKYDDASQYYARAMKLSDALGTDSPEVFEDMSGAMRSYLGGLAGDAWSARHALETTEKKFGQNHPLVAKALLTVARGYSREPTTAEGFVTRALTIQERALGASHPDLATTLSALAAIYEASGRSARAVESRARAAEIREENLGLLLSVGSEAQKRLYMSTLEDETNATISLHALRAAKDPAAARLALVTVLRRKGRVLDAMVDALSSLRRRLGPNDQAVLDELKRVRAQLATLVIRGPGVLDPQAHRTLIEKLEAQSQALESRLGEDSGLSAVLERATLEKVQGAIPGDAALIEFVSYRPLELDSGSADGSFGAPHYAAYVLKSNGQPAFADLGDAAAIDLEVRALRLALSDPQKDPAGPAAQLHRRIVAPLAGHLAGARHLLLSPDGALNLVPFAALTDESGTPLTLTYELSYLTTGRDLLRFGKAQRSSSVPVVLANPDFGAKSAEQQGGTALSRATFTELPGTQAEAMGVSEELKDPVLWTRQEATEKALKSVHSPEILHVATHGFFLEGKGSGSQAQRALVFEESAPDTTVLKIENPLLRSGLALASANMGKTDADNDGVLTALEAAGLELSGTRLVVLSACETGVGEIKTGDGVYGLRRAFVMAGAETEIMSLWKVDDAATRDLMVAFYQALRSGQGRASALRSAQHLIMESPARRHPYYWASFIASGDFRPLSATAASKPGAVAPSARGCACEQAGARAADAGWSWATLLLGLMMAARRKLSSAREGAAWADANRRSPR